MDNRVDRVLTALKGLEIKCNVPLSSQTSFRIGGPAAMVLRPHGAEDIRRSIQSCSQFGVPYCVLGNGTNVLAPDAGYPGLVIHGPFTAARLFGHARRGGRSPTRFAFRAVAPVFAGQPV